MFGCSLHSSKGASSGSCRVQTPFTLSKSGLLNYMVAHTICASAHLFVYLNKLLHRRATFRIGHVEACKRETTAMFAVVGRYTAEAQPALKIVVSNAGAQGACIGNRS